MPRPIQRRRVGLLIESSRAYGRGLLQGIAKYVREHENWTISFEEWTWSQVPAWLADWEGDGLIARIETRELARVIRKLNIPTVDLRGSVPNLNLPLIDTDDQAVSALAAEHLWERGFRHFAFCGFVGANYSDTRSRWFMERVAELGGDCRACLPRQQALTSSTIELERRELRFQADLARWLDELPKPIGIMACNDIRGQQVMKACRQLGLLVPDEVAVIGVDNDDVLCELSDPPLTSIMPNTLRIGYEAAAVLDRLMRGQKPPKGPRYVPPLGVVTRRSTDVLTIPDRAIASVLRFIREHACDGIQVPDLVAVAALSRTVLERRFTRLVGCSPKAEILRVQLARARQLLTETDLPLSVIAERSGFKHPEYFNVIFKLKIGQTPGRYRQRNQSEMP
ncbi:MAG TPA: DNA-binding transcriptional regulator [Verrucomicrobiae bacterium]|nr:DNA-binding transcriptional regulator [Verrucomicrobiae bacterium]